MRSRRTVLVGVLAAAAACLGALTAVPATAHPAPSASAEVKLGHSTIAWGPCGQASGLSTVAGAQCAMLAVPLDYSRPHGPTIQLAISRIQHTVPAAQFQGVMLVNPGGPGGSGLSLSVLGSYVPNGVGKDYDWVGFDPRGVGSSVPSISCDPNYFSFDRPSYIPTTPSLLKTWDARSRGYAQACAKYGALLNHMTTVDSARDMDSIRQALGASQINYYGFSYGTYLGQVYSTLFPNRVRREVLDSNVDPRKIWYQANLDQDVAFDRNINIWFGWLAKYNSVYHLGATQTAVKNLWYRTLAKLTAHPADGKIGGSEWTDTFEYAPYYQQTWLEQAQVFSDFINKGNVTELENEYANVVGLGDDNEFAVYNAVQCTDIQYPRSQAKILADNWRIYSQYPYLTWSNNWFNAPCQYWPAPAHATQPFAVSGKHIRSALLIDETLDAATPYPGSLEVRSLFPNARLLALPGGTSHANSLNGDTCEDDMIANYLATGALPARKRGNGPDATCAPLPQPVPTATSQQAPASGATPGSVGASAAVPSNLVPAVQRQQ